MEILNFPIKIAPGSVFECGPISLWKCSQCETRFCFTLIALRRSAPSYLTNSVGLSAKVRVYLVCPKCFVRSFLYSEWIASSLADLSTDIESKSWVLPMISIFSWQTDHFLTLAQRACLTYIESKS